MNKRKKRFYVYGEEGREAEEG